MGDVIDLDEFKHKLRWTHATLVGATEFAQNTVKSPYNTATDEQRKMLRRALEVIAELRGKVYFEQPPDFDAIVTAGETWLTQGESNERG